MRSFDQRSHSYPGYILTLVGTIDGSERPFTVALGKAAQAKHQFQVGDEVSGHAEPVPPFAAETAEFYKASKLKLIARSQAPESAPPPWHGPPPELPTYRSRGHRRLEAKTYATHCRSCIWACLMPVDIMIDQWDHSRRSSRTETFCYGPLSCPVYKAGPKRRVSGRRGMSYVEEDWVDEEAVAHRLPDE